MRIKRKVRELKNADVRTISLVKRGANRIPIKIQKSDKSGEATMGIDLNGVGSRVRQAGYNFKNVFKQEAPAQAVVSALVFPKKPENYDQMKSVVEKAGYVTTKPIEEKDGSFVFAQMDDYDKDSQTLRLSDNLIVVTKGFQPWAEDLEDFNDVMKAQGFYNGVDAACSALRSSLCMKMGDTDNPQEAAQAVSEVLKDFTSYIVGLANGLPSNAFKLDGEVDKAVVAFKAELVKKAEEDAKAKAEKEKVEKGEMKKPADMDQAKWDAMSDEDKKKVQKAEGTDSTVDPNKKVEGTVVEKSDAKLVLDGLQEQLVRLTESLNTLASGQKKLGEQVATVVQKSDALEKKIKGAVVAGATPGDAPATDGSGVVTKSDPGPFNGSFDSAFAPKGGKARH